MSIKKQAISEVNIADLLSRTIYMKKAGTGIKRVKGACKANNNVVNFDFTDAFWVVINSNIEKLEKDVGKELSETQEAIFKLLKDNK